MNLASRKRLMRAGYLVHVVDPLPHLNEHCRDVEWLNQFSDSSLLKFRSLELECIDRLVYLEPDSIVIRNIDELFDKKFGPANAVKPYDNPTGPTTAVMVLTPSKDILRSSLQELQDLDTQQCGDAQLLSRILANANGGSSATEGRPPEPSLPDTYSVHYQDFNEDTNIQKEAAVVYFRSTSKPWRTSSSNEAGVKLWWEFARHFYSQKMVLWKQDKQRTRARIIGDLQAWIKRIVLPLTWEGRPIALLDYPAHRNTGDQAIWMGEKILFHENSVEINFECASFLNGFYRYISHDCNFSELRKILGKDGLIFLHGGGNFRNYPGKNKIGYYQHFRHKVIAAFPDHQIVVLPQTINFEKQFPDVLNEVKTSLGSHKNLTLLWRDTFSLQFAQEHFPNALSVLCPDMAFMIGLLGYKSLETQHFFTPGPFPPPIHKMVWIGRLDAEKIIDREHLSGDLDKSLGEKTDWNLFPKPKETEFTDRAAELLTAGIEFLSKGKVVVTDRLHGMIIGTLLGKPVVAMDNNYGKLTKYHSTFLADEPNIYWSHDEPEALLMAQYLAEGQELKALDWSPHIS
eukprot:CAMPEP_0184648306 /NCGR_PEP_ID=MMETSP0308-20130426/5396_1 /TAXON_ID=38269 /ORGANISM="Gloeochaete witrockiana, Strain SAG 46.84" /LENGTH=571 /DNA_ID=CAMNT_0027080029 /DNA_START=349 /DNA_END=2064 /DNA_ORIENTATION=+